MYSVFGGTPAYFMATEKGKSVFENIVQRILSVDAVLYKDVEFVLRMELSEPRYYFSILLSIAKGNNRIGLIMNDCGLSKGLITKYLSILIDLQLVQRRVPVTETHKSRKGLYILSDNLFDFWFRFVHPNMERIERGDGDMVLESSVRPQFSSYAGKHFEAIVEDLFLEFNQKGLLPFRFETIGSWWDKGVEIDLVALSETERACLFCECKWQDAVNAEQVLSLLKDKAAGVPWNKENRSEYFCIVARSFSVRCAGTDRTDQIICLDADDLARLHQRCRTG
jgi:AAA+ ATPase superfamily predicted ATPase